MKLCVQDGGLYSIHKIMDAYDIIARAGFEAIDWNIDIEIRGSALEAGTYAGNIFEKSIEEITEYYKDELAAMRKAGLTISQAHAPFPFYNTKFQNPETPDYLIGIYKKIILFLDTVGCKNLIIHGVSLARADDEHTLDDYRALNKKLYTSLIPELQKTNVTVCLENLFSKGITAGHCCDPHDAAREIDELNALAGKECFGLCLDTGHLNLIGGDLRHYLPIIGKRLKSLHIHDNDGITDMHKAPYTGTINWKHFYTMLKEIGYEGDLSFETFRQTDPNVIDLELLEPWMVMIAQIGAFFRKKILE